VEVVASISQGRTDATQCGLFTHKSVPVIFEPPCIYEQNSLKILNGCFRHEDTSVHVAPRYTGAKIYNR